MNRCSVLAEASGPTNNDEQQKDFSSQFPDALSLARSMPVTSITFLQMMLIIWVGSRLPARYQYAPYGSLAPQYNQLLAAWYMRRLGYRSAAAALLIQAAGGPILIPYSVPTSLHREDDSLTLLLPPQLTPPPTKKPKNIRSNNHLNPNQQSPSHTTSQWDHQRSTI